MKENKLWWGFDELHPRRSSEHFLVVGASGSGKTTLISMLMRSVLEGHPDRRALVYDPKQEALAQIHGLFPGVTDEEMEARQKVVSRLKILHPLDNRCCAWDLSADIDGPISARQFANILIPDDRTASGRSSDSFFDDAVRDLLTGTLLAFINCTPNRVRWTFRDVLLTLLYQPNLAFMMTRSMNRLLEPFPMLGRLRDSYLNPNGDSRTTANIRSTINSKLSIYEPIAAIWDKAIKDKSSDRSFSLNRWLEPGSNQILVLGNDEAGRSAIDPINRAIFKRATELILARREWNKSNSAEGKDTTWFFLDEIREAGRLDGLSRLLTKGRSKGACVVLGFQDIDGMRDVYGKEVTGEICGQCQHVAVLKLSSPSTAEWAVELFGKDILVSRSASLSQGKDQSQGSSESQQVWSLVQTAELLHMSLPNRSGIEGFYKKPREVWALSNDEWNPSAGFEETIPEEIIRVRRPKATDYPGFIPSHPKEHYLMPWTASEWALFGFGSPMPDLSSLAENVGDQKVLKKDPEPSEPIDLSAPLQKRLEEKRKGDSKK